MTKNLSQNRAAGLAASAPERGSGTGSKLIVGCGYLGRRVAAGWRAAGHQVVAVTRTGQDVASLCREGLLPVIADVPQPDTLAALPPADTVLYAVGYDSAGGKSRWDVYVEGLRAVLDAISPDVQRFLFISSTGVYGQTDGAWVDEDSPCQPAREAGRAFLAAEQLLREHALGARAVVLRTAGIYGPGRLQRVADILAGKPLSVPEDNYLNLIHVDDAAAIVVAAADRAPPARTYLVSDGHPVDRREYFTWLAERLGAPAPAFLVPSAEVLAAHHSGSNKRVSNARMMVDLGMQLRYPTFREGVPASMPVSYAP